jgi:P2 family phage contractile tail tube protein
MVGAVEFPSGIEKLESKIKWNSFYADTLKKIGNPTQVLSWQIRGSLESYNSGGKTGEVPVVIFMKASCKDLPMGNFKQHDNVELESNLSVYYAKLEINGEPISEIDVLANIHKVGGQDILGAYRQNIGG